MIIIFPFLSQNKISRRPPKCNDNFNDLAIQTNILYCTIRKYCEIKVTFNLFAFNLSQEQKGNW